MRMKLIKLQKGAAVVPIDFLTVRIHSSANYAGILMDEQGVIPEIAFTSKKDVSQYTEADEKAIIEICRNVYPEVFEIFKQQELELQAGPNINTDQWNKINKIGIRPLQETNDVRDAYFHGAIMRETIDFDFVKEKYNCQFEEEEFGYED